MRTVMRALIILAAALVVVGATVAVAPRTGALASGAGVAQFDGSGPGTDAGQFAQGGGPGDFGEREGGEGGWAGLAKNVGVVGLLTVGVVLATKGAEAAQGVVRRAWPTSG